MQILESLNAGTGKVRTLAQIKRKFDNLKTKAKKTVAANKQSVTRTGGGPSEYTDIDPVTDAVLEMINMKTVTTMNSFDDTNTWAVKKNTLITTGPFTTRAPEKTDTCRRQ
jgi:hypothetical protein